MKKRMMLIINPMAGRSGYKNGFGEVMNILDSGGYLTTVYFTQGRGDATLFAAQHAAEYDTVACIGGDGTLSEVVSGLMQVPNPPPLGYIPMGTTNDVASTLGLPKNASTASTTTARMWSMTAARSTGTSSSAACRTRPPWPAWCACARTS